MKLNIEFKNYKLLKDTKATLDGSNVYLVQGANEQGKTSFINGLLTMLQAENKTKQPVTIGEKNGQIKLDIENKAGEKSSILFEFSDQKNKFTLISDSKMMTKVTDIRAFLGYQSLTADEFISWSNTAEGRRKQRDIVLGLLGQTVKEEFIDLAQKERKTYDDRTQINAMVKSLQVIVDQEQDISVSIDEINKIPSLKHEVEDLKSEKEKEERANHRSRCINDTLQGIICASNHLESEFNFDEDFCGNIRKIATERLQCIYDTQLSQNNIYKIIDEINKLESAKAQSYSIDKNNKLLTEKKAEVVRLNNELGNIRAEKDRIIRNSNFPIKDLVITEDGLMVKTADGLLPFDINQVSTSRIMIIVAKIILMLNKHLPIIVMGRGEAFDQEKLAELSKFADENSCMLIIDKVTNTAGIEIVGYENNLN